MNIYKKTDCSSSWYFHIFKDKKAAMFPVIEILNYQDNKHSLYENSL